MIFSRERVLLVSMREYESYKFGAFVSMGHADFGVSDGQLAAMSDEERDLLHEAIKSKVYETLQQELTDDIKDARDLTEDRKSFILNSLRGTASTPSHAMPPSPSARPTVPIRRVVPPPRKGT